ncbi:MAG: TIGR04282 family arsenosugar biosynthesis glycosyltransferase [Acidobacteria bacterium]|nr:TIGR04282 family arsenosugar biosynthesis glycosyltransferase [Acidobacteriota bacterium]
MKRAIVIMTKVPQAGRVKTRLHDALAAADCETLAAAFLKDAAGKARAACENVFIAFTPPDEIQKLREILPEETNFIEQTGADLGERMSNAFREMFRRGTASVVMIGTDSPTFPTDYIEQAFEFLETNSDVVLGKTDDGGFYLIGLRVWRPEIFERIKWSAPETFEQVYRKIDLTDLHLRETPGWYDVDEAHSLIRLKNEILQNTNAKRRAPHTFEWITAHLS